MRQPIQWRPDQAQVLEWMLPRRRAACWASGGSGKTVLALTWLWHWTRDAFEVERALVVAPPLPAARGWPEQLDRWAHLEGLGPYRVLTAADFGLTEAALIEWEATNGRGEVVTRAKKVPKKRAQEALERLGVGQGTPDPEKQPGGPAARRAGLVFGDKPAAKSHLLALTEPIHIVSWTFFPWLAQAYGTNWPYGAVVFDESSWLRDPGSERHRAARHALRRAKTPATHVLELTASPAANHQEAVWSQLDLLQPGVMGETITAFREEFCTADRKNWSTGQVYSWKVAQSQAERFHAICASLAVSVPSTLEVPLVHVEHWVDLPEAAMVAHEALGEDGVWNGIVCGSEAVRHSKKRQAASGWVYTGADLATQEDSQAVPLHDVKLDWCEEIVLAAGGPVIVAFEFKEELKRLKARFGKRIADIRDRGAMDAFIAGKLDILAIHPASAGHGVDGLQHVCNTIVWLTAPQDRELFDQANWRVHRQGTKHQTVYCHAILARNTVEAGIWRTVLPGKRALEDRLLAATAL